MRDYHLVVLGSGGVGKTSLIHRFLTGRYSDEYTPTVDDMYRPIVRLQDRSIHSIEILDTAGYHQFPAMRHLSIQSGRAFIVVFSMDNDRSLKDAIGLVDSVRQRKGDSVPIVVVGNKADLEPAVRPSSIEQLAQSCLYVETSAKQDVNVHRVFLLVLNALFNVVHPLPTPCAGSKRPRRLHRRLTTAMRRSLSSSSNESDSSTTSSEGYREHDRCVLM